MLYKIETKIMNIYKESKKVMGNKMFLNIIILKHIDII